MTFSFIEAFLILKFYSRYMANFETLYSWTMQGYPFYKTNRGSYNNHKLVMTDTVLTDVEVQMMVHFQQRLDNVRLTTSGWYPLVPCCQIYCGRICLVIHESKKVIIPKLVSHMTFDWLIRYLDWMDISLI